MEDIHFLVDEISEKLNSDMKSVLQQIKDPNAKKRIKFINKFTLALARAAAPKVVKKPTHPVAMQRPVQQYVNEVQKEMVHEQRFPRLYGQPYYGRITTPKVQQPLPQPVPAQPTSSNPTQPLPPPVQKLATPIGETLEIDPSQEIMQEPPQANEDSNVSLIKESETKKNVVHAEIRGEMYTVIEPHLTDDDKKLLTEARKELENNPDVLKDKIKVYKQLQKTAKRLKIKVDKGDEGHMIKLRYYLVRNLLNFAQVEPLMHDDHVTKIICEGIDKPIMIIRNGQQLHTNIQFTSQELINNLLKEIAKKTYHELSLDNPILDATYKNYRIQGTLGSEVVPAKFIISKGLT